MRKGRFFEAASVEIMRHVCPVRLPPFAPEIVYSYDDGLKRQFLDCRLAENADMCGKVLEMTATLGGVIATTGYTKSKYVPFIDFNGLDRNQEPFHLTPHRVPRHRLQARHVNVPMIAQLQFARSMFPDPCSVTATSRF